MRPDRALEICEEAVRLSSSDDVVARLWFEQEGATRFANDAITQNVARRSATLRVRVAFGRRRAEVTTNRFDREALREAVARAEAIARWTPEDPEHLPPAGPVVYREVPQGLPGTADTGPAERAEAVARAVAEVGGELKASGAYTTTGASLALASSHGARGACSTSWAEVHATAIGPTSSGWAKELSRDGREVDAARVVRRARDLALRSAEPRVIEPGEYRVVLAPAAVAELLQFLVGAATAKEVDEGRSALSGLEGGRIVSDRLTVRSVLADPACPGLPFDDSGLPTDDTTWIDRGVLRTLITSRFWARRSGRPHTPFPGVVSVDGTDRSEEDLIRQVDRGLYVTRFWYSRQVDPMRLLVTGMTRDGLFLIEDGRIVGGLKHLRYNDSPLRVFSGVVDVGRAVVVRPYVTMRAPSLLVDGVRFTSGTSF